MKTVVAAGPTLRVGGGLTLRFLGLELEADGAEVYDISIRRTAGAAWRGGRLKHLGGSSWTVLDDQAASGGTFSLGLPDAVFAFALGQPALAPEVVARATPHWPAALHGRLARRRASGACTIAFDGRWFLSRLTGSPIDRPLFLPGAADTLGLADLVDASEVLTDAAAPGGDDPRLIALLERGLDAVTGTQPAWNGEGRLIGESTWGDLSQVGADIAEGCRLARGRGALPVAFDPHEPMGLGFAPEVPSAEVAVGRQPAPDASVGTGAEVGVVEPGGAADAAGVTAGMVARRLSAPDFVLDVDGVTLPFEDILSAIDARRDAGERLAVTFDTAAPFSRWYAVEMPAASALAAFGASAGEDPEDAGVGASFDALCAGALLWREPIPRLFLGAPGSMTCAHVDICPQVQLAHGLLGTKVLGIASHQATPRLVAEHGGTRDGSIDEGATHVPTDRPLTPRQARLLADADVSLVFVQPGDLAVLHSGALHFASNGAEGLSASLYHGVITPAAVPRLRADAAAPGGSGAASEDAYAGHLFAADLLQLVERRSRSGGG